MNMKASIKEKIVGSLGFFGYILFYLILLVFLFFPLYFIGLPWWADLILVLVVVNTNVIGGILTLILWIWSFVIVISHSIGLLEILYFVFFVAYIGLFIVPGIRNAVLISKSNKY